MVRTMSSVSRQRRACTTSTLRPSPSSSIPTETVPGVSVTVEASAAPGAALIWTLLLVAALVVIVAVARTGSALFWRTAGEVPAGRAPPLDCRAVGATAGLLACVLGLVAWGGAATSYAWETARQLADPAGYVAAVLGAGDGVREHRRSLR
jgi:formate hydrogenlyase subunit 3/multisubunit Na+/H+ antiporter MnhD subunit